MTEDPNPLRALMRWPADRRLVRLAAIGIAALVVVWLILMLISRAAAPAPPIDDGRPGLVVAHRDAPEPVITPGEKMEVMRGAANEFQGVPEAPRRPPVVIGDWIAGLQGPPEGPPVILADRPAARSWTGDRPMEPARVTPPAEARLHRSDGGSPDGGPEPRPDCTYARTRAEAMVCREPRLAALDGQMRAAFARAMDRASDPGLVLRDQQRWERARENAAIDGPGAVESVYRLRLRELDF